MQVPDRGCVRERRWWHGARPAVGSRCPCWTDSRGRSPMTRSRRCRSNYVRVVRLPDATANSRRGNEMSSTTDRTEIEALFQRLAKAHADHDADAIVEAYAPDAVIYDLAPPLGR